MFTKKSNESHEPCGLGISQLRKLSDETLMAHLKHGHDDALTILFERYHRLVFSIAIKTLHDEAEAEDVTQNVFLEVFRNAVQFDPEKGSTKVWLLQYAYHRSFNRLRYLKVRGLQYGSEIASELEAQVDDAFLVATKTLDVIDRTRMVRQAFRVLTSAQSKTLRLAFFEGLTLKEISEQTGEPLGNVRHHYYRGLDRMRSHLESRTADDAISGVAGATDDVRTGSA
jgi:RNA polymerase sigma-70 factor (ECF subfamily)